jgi:hypothetical protein
MSGNNPTSQSTASASLTFVTSPEFPKNLLETMITTDKNNNSFEPKTDIPMHSTFFGNDVVNAYIAKQFKNAVKNTTFADVKNLLPQTIPSSVADSQARFNTAFVSAVGKKLLNANTLSASDTDIVNYIVSAALPGKGINWYNIVVNTISPSDLVSQFKLSFSTSSPYAPTEVVVDIVNDPYEDVYNTASPFSLLLDLSSSKLAVAIYANGNGPLLSDDVPENFFNISDAAKMVLGATPNFSGATNTTVAQVLAIAKKVSPAGILIDLSTAGVSGALVVAQKDPRVVTALKAAKPDTLWSNYITSVITTGSIDKTVTGGKLSFPLGVKQIAQYVALTGVSTETLLAMYDSTSGDQTNATSTQFVNALKTTPSSVIGTGGISGFTPGSNLEAYLNYVSPLPEDPKTVKTSADLANYLTGDVLHGAVRTLISSGTVAQTSVGTTTAFNAGSAGTLSGYLSAQTSASIDTVYDALSQVAAKAISASKSTMTTDEVLRSTFSVIETNLNKGDFPLNSTSVTSGAAFFATPASTDPATKEWVKTLIGFFMTQCNAKLMDNADNHQHLSKFIKIGSFISRGTNGAIVTAPLQLYGLGVIGANSSCPAVSFLTSAGGLQYLASSSANMYAAYKANLAPSVSASSDLSIRTFISTVIGNSVNTTTELDQLFAEFGLPIISALKSIPVDKANAVLLSAPTGGTGFASAANGLQTAYGFASTDAGNAAALASLKLTSALMDIAGSDTNSYTKAKRQLDTLNSNKGASDALLLNNSGAIIQNFIQNILEQGFFDDANAIVGSSKVKGADAMTSLKSAVTGVYALTSSIANAVVSTSSQPGLSIATSNNIQSLGKTLNKIINKEAYVTLPNTPEIRQTYADYVTGLTVGKLSMIVVISAAAQVDGGVNARHLTKGALQELRAAQVPDSDIRGAITARPGISGFIFTGPIYEYFVGVGVDGSDMFDE